MNKNIIAPVELDHFIHLNYVYTCNIPVVYYIIFCNYAWYLYLYSFIIYFYYYCYYCCHRAPFFFSIFVSYILNVCTYYFIYDRNCSLNWQLSKVVCLVQHVSVDMIFCSLMCCHILLNPHIWGFSIIL